MFTQRCEVFWPSDEGAEALSFFVDECGRRMAVIVFDEGVEGLRCEC